MYVGPSRKFRVRGGIRVYDYNTRRLVETDTYRVLQHVPHAWTMIDLKFFTADGIVHDQHTPALVDTNRPGMRTRGGARMDQETTRARNLQDGVQDEPDKGNHQGTEGLPAAEELVPTIEITQEAHQDEAINPQTDDEEDMNVSEEPELLLEQVYEGKEVSEGEAPNANMIRAVRSTPRTFMGEIPEPQVEATRLRSLRQAMAARVAIGPSSLGGHPS
jgi:hypothetical protein